MLSKRLIFLIIAGFLSYGCAPDGSESEYLIGKPLDGTSGLSTTLGTTSDQVVTYDKMTQRIHRFKLSSLEHLGSIRVDDGNASHYLLASASGRFIADLSNKQVNVYNANGELQRNPVKIHGTPVSAAFLENLNYIVIYDDLMSVSILKLNNQGNVVSTFVSGPIVSEGEQIVSGDLSEDGNLILGLSSGNIAVVDLELTLVQQEWAPAMVNVALNDMKWIAPVPGKVSEVLVRTTKKLVLVDLVTAAPIEERDLGESSWVTYSKDGAPHMFFQRSWSSQSPVVYYVQDSKIKEIHLNRNFEHISHSSIDLENDKWTLIESDSEERPSTRSLIQYRLSTLEVQSSTELPVEPQLNLASDYVFALYPSDLGLAQRFSVVSGETKEIKLFNLKYMK